MESKKILIIPDACIGNSSGAEVCQVAISLLQELGHTVTVYSEDIPDYTEKNGVTVIPRPRFKASANYNSKAFRTHFKDVLKAHDIQTAFFIGSITNKPLCYLEECYAHHIKVVIKIFMQDFFCSKFYANDDRGICTKCLDNKINALRNQCCGKGLRNGLITLNRILTRRKLQKLLKKADSVITSTDQQIGFYQRFGIEIQHCIKTPLYFHTNKYQNIKPSFGDYYIGIAQDRVEKGFHLLPPILSSCRDNVHVILAYPNEAQRTKALSNKEVQYLVQQNRLELIVASRNDGLMDLVAGAKGVIIPSIWPTTTEYGLLEALALKKCVFTFDIGIHHEVIRNGVNGYTFALNDNLAFADALSQYSSEQYSTMLSNIESLYCTLTDRSEWSDTLKAII